MRKLRGEAKVMFLIYGFWNAILAAGLCYLFSASWLLALAGGTIGFFLGGYFKQRSYRFLLFFYPRNRGPL